MTVNTLSHELLAYYITNTLTAQLTNLKLDLIQIESSASSNPTHHELLNALHLAVQNTEILMDKMREIERKVRDGRELEGDEWDLVRELGLDGEEEQEEHDQEEQFEAESSYTYQTERLSSSPRAAQHNNYITSEPISFEEDEVIVEKSSYVLRRNGNESYHQRPSTSPTISRDDSSFSSGSPQQQQSNSHASRSSPPQQSTQQQFSSYDDEEDEGSPPLHAQHHRHDQGRQSNEQQREQTTSTQHTQSQFTPSSPNTSPPRSPLSQSSDRNPSPQPVTASSKALNTSFTFHNDDDVQRIRQELNEATQTQEDYEKTIANLESCLENEVAEKVQATRQTESLLARMKEQERRWQQKLSEKDQIIQQQASEIASLKEQLQQQENPQVDQSLATILDDMKKGAEMLQNQFTESFSFERNRLLEELNRTKSDLLFLQQAEESREQEFAHLQDELKQRSSKMQQLQQSSKQYEQEISQLRDEIESLQAENDELRNARKDTGSLTFSLNRKIQALEETVEQLKIQRDMHVQKYLTDAGINLFDTVLKGETQVLRDYIEQMKVEMAQRSTSVNKDMQKLKSMVGKITEDTSEPLFAQREKQETVEQMLMDLEKFHTYRPEYRAHPNDPVDKLVCEVLQSINTGHVRIDVQRLSQGEYMIDRPFRVRVVNEQPVIRIGSAYTPLRDYLMHLYAPYLVSSEDMHTSAYRESYDLSKHYIASRIGTTNAEERAEARRSSSTPPQRHRPSDDSRAPLQRGTSTINVERASRSQLSTDNAGHYHAQDNSQTASRQASNGKPPKSTPRTRTPTRSTSRSPQQTKLHTKHTRSSRAQIKRSTLPVPPVQKLEQNGAQRGSSRRSSPNTARVKRSTSRSTTPIRHPEPALRASSNPKSRTAAPSVQNAARGSMAGKITKPPTFSQDIHAQLQNAKNLDEAQIKQLKKLALKQQIEMMRQRK